MRTAEDIILIRMDLHGTIELDLERIEEDPNWRTITSTLPLPQEMDLAIKLYVQHYVIRERFLRDMVSTNGPGSLLVTQMEVVNGQPNSAAADGSSGST